MLAFLRLMSLQGERCREPWGVGDDCVEAASPVGALAGVAAVTFCRPHTAIVAAIMELLINLAVL